MPSAWRKPPLLSPVVVSPASWFVALHLSQGEPDEKLTFGAALAALIVLAAGVSATAATAKTRHRVALTLVGAQIGPTETVYEAHGTSRGAVVQLFKNNATGTGGTSKSTSYDGQGTTPSREAYTLSPPDASGIVTISGGGRIVSGTGKYKGVKGTYKFTGTFNSQTTVASVKVIGTETY